MWLCIFSSSLPSSLHTYIHMYVHPYTLTHTSAYKYSCAVFSWRLFTKEGTLIMIQFKTVFCSKFISDLANRNDVKFEQSELYTPSSRHLTKERFNSKLDGIIIRELPKTATISRAYFRLESQQKFHKIRNGIGWCR